MDKIEASIDITLAFILDCIVQSNIFFFVDCMICCWDREVLGFLFENEWLKLQDISHFKRHLIRRDESGYVVTNYTFLNIKVV